MPETVVIAGGGLTAASAAESLRKEGFDGRIVICAEEPHLPYDRPPLSKEVLTGNRDAASTALHDEAWYAERSIEALRGTRVTQIDRSERMLLAGGSLVRYTVLLIATGASPRALDVPGASLDGVRLLRTCDDAASIAMALEGGARVVIVGAGFIGCEVAASARTRGCEVTMVEPLPAPLARALGEETGAAIGEIHRARGVDLRTGTGVEAFEGEGAVRRARLTDGTTVDADLVVVGIGVTPNVEIAREAGIACDDGVLVDALCRTSAPGIYAAGDCARRLDPITGEPIRVEHWDNAAAQGAAAGRAMAGRQEPFVHVPWFWSDQYEHSIQMSGHPLRWDRIVRRGDLSAGDGIACYLEGARLRAVLGIGRNRDVRAGRTLIERGITPFDADLADDGFDLRAAARAAG